jgi:glycosyltransferase involved in cell wall biosynthesis
LKVFNNKTILIISSEPWTHNFVSKHHYAIHLASSDNRVYFLNPPSGTKKVSKTEFANLHTVDYKPIIRGLNRLPWLAAKHIYEIEIRSIVKMIGAKPNVVWSFDPFRFQDLGMFNASLNIYYAADWHQIETLEQKLASSAHIVLSPSQLLLDKIVTSAVKIKIDHAIADHFFQITKPIKLPGRNAIKVAYMGNLKMKFLNTDLLFETIKQNQQCDFILIGNAGTDRFTQQIDSLSNAYTLGRVKNNEIPAIIQHCDIMLLCYDTVTYWQEASNSHKILEYLSTGKAVVSTMISEYKDKGHLLFMPEKMERLPELLKHVCSNLSVYNSEKFSVQRTAYAFDNTYTKQLARIDDIISKMMLHADN